MIVLEQNMGVRVVNNFHTTLADSVTSSATTLPLAPGSGNILRTKLSGSPNTALPTDDWLYLTLVNVAGYLEIVKVTALAATGDNVTVERGVDGTTARAWSVGDGVACRPCAALFEDTLSYYFPIAISKGGTGATTSAGARTALGAQAYSANLDKYAVINPDKAIYIPEYTDLNTLTKSGVYNGRLCANSPTAGTVWIYVEVIRHTGFVEGTNEWVAQRATIQHSTVSSEIGAVYVRQCKSPATWSPWQRLATTEDIPQQKIVQFVEATPYTAYVSTYAVIPVDDTIPQQTEGTQIISVTITPTNANNRLFIESITPVITPGIYYDSNSGNWIPMTAVCALFKDNAPNALAVSLAPGNSNGTAGPCLVQHEMVAGTTAPITFKLRIGVASTQSYVYINGSNSSRLFGGVAAVRLRVMEVAV